MKTQASPPLTNYYIDLKKKMINHQYNQDIQNFILNTHNVWNTYWHCCDDIVISNTIRECVLHVIEHFKSLSYSFPFRDPFNLCFFFSRSLDKRKYKIYEYHCLHDWLCLVICLLIIQDTRWWASSSPLLSYCFLILHFLYLL